MKSIAVIFYLGAIVIANGQNHSDVKTEVRNIFAVYEKQSIPYLQSFAQNLLSPVERNTKDGKYLERAHFLYYKAKLGVIEGTCSEYILSKSSSDPSLTGKNLRKSISKYLNDEFKNIYPGLTYEFYEKVKTEIERL